LKARLTDLGFLKSIIVETIVSTYNGDGKPNAAPMGVTMIDDEHLSIDFFISSATFSNIKAHRCAVVNLTSDIEVFYKTAFKEANLDGTVPQEWFEKATVVNAPKLRSADATIDISIYHLEALGVEKARAFFKVRLLQAQEKYPQIYCRAFSATLEAIIHATRVKAFANVEGKQKKVSKLMELIENGNDVVNRVAPNSVYSAVMADLMKRIDSWRSKPEDQH
jgi:hypothetical protein